MDHVEWQSARGSQAMRLLPPGHHEMIFELYSDVSQRLHITTRREIARGQNAQMMGFELKPLILMPQPSLSLTGDIFWLGNFRGSFTISRSKFDKKY